AEPLELVVEQYVEAISRGRRRPRLGQPVGQRIPYQPSGAAFDRRNIDRGKALCDRSAAAAGLHRLEPAGRERQRDRGEEYESPHVTMLTSLSGTTITLRTSAPPSERWTFSLPSASASSSSFGRPFGAVSVSRSLPMCWTAMVTSSSTSSAGSASGQ